MDLDSSVVKAKVGWWGLDGDGQRVRKWRTSIMVSTVKKMAQNKNTINEENNLPESFSLDSCSRYCQW